MRNGIILERGNRRAGYVGFLKGRRVRLWFLPVFTVLLGMVCGVCRAQFTPLPLPEHPRPDFERRDWVNLNGRWRFAFDEKNDGERSGWQSRTAGFSASILVPFPWGSPLSGVSDKGSIGWYARKVRVPEQWRSKRVFVVVGASDWTTKGWLDGHSIGTHRGGYTPFEFELSSHVRFGEEQELVFRVDDTPHPFKLEGKQGYGPARGIWQTVYLEARPAIHLDSVRFTPDVDSGRVTVGVTLDQPALPGSRLRVVFKTGGVSETVQPFPAGQRELRLNIAIPDGRLWSLSDPFLYEVQLKFESPGSLPDEVHSYFGMRKISVVRLPGSGLPYIGLNNKPVYLRLALDQSYHPGGYYTFPDDEFMRDEILRARRIGLNGLRLHVKVDVPRKLYWADRLGVLIMADLPNSWGEPDSEMRAEVETALRGMVRRDYNHPAIFSWVIFNETWGLKTKKQGYLPETQRWVESLYRLTKTLDPSRLVEDNSPCNYDHVSTDINSWHQYLPGYRWKQHLEEVVAKTYVGSDWNFIGGRRQGDQPLLNSECGNVWGYEGSTGDVDWSWDYHIMMNEFRKHPKICGWLYTEHHDVVNEWNGYYRYDRSHKETGLSDLVPGMDLRDLHSPYYLLADTPLCSSVLPGLTASIPLSVSCMADAPTGPLVLRSELYGWDDLGRRTSYWKSVTPVQVSPWSVAALPPLTVTMPDSPGVAVLTFCLENSAGSVLHRNFATFVVAGAAERRDREMQGQGIKLVRFAPDSFKEAKWSLRQWNVLEGLKVNGAGSGYFEYRVGWPEGLDASRVQSAAFKAELSAKQLFGKDRLDIAKQQGDFMLGKGARDPGLNPNAYPMTDEKKFPSAVRIRVEGEPIGLFDLPDDPADHRGLLSWFSQRQDRHLREAGSYGYLISADIPRELLKKAAQKGELIIRLEVDEALPGGLAIYGARFGRYPLDPTIIFFTTPEKGGTP